MDEIDVRSKTLRGRANFLGCSMVEGMVPIEILGYNESWVFNLLLRLLLGIIDDVLD